MWHSTQPWKHKLLFGSWALVESQRRPFPLGNSRRSSSCCCLFFYCTLLRSSYSMRTENTEPLGPESHQADESLHQHCTDLIQLGKCADATSIISPQLNPDGLTDKCKKEIRFLGRGRKEGLSPLAKAFYYLSVYLTPPEKINHFLTSRY